MVRLTFYIILALFFAFGAAWISSNPGQVLITWQGWEVRFSIAVFIMLAIFYFLIIWSVLKLYKWLNIATYLGNPKRLAAKRQKANLDLDHAWSAYALGDYKEAIKFALRAKSKLGEDHNILRLLASATEASGETNNPYLETLGKSPQSAPWVQKQQLDHYIQDKSWEAALPLVNSMLETHTSNGYLLKMAFLLLARLGKWPESYQALQNALQVKGAIVPSEKGHLKAVIEYCLALEKKAGGQKTESHALLKAALKNDSSFAPAALLSAQLYIEQNDK
ncbi:MAG: hypothetical protein HOM01_03045, partial [Kordiimonadaceae bacterium]|nr:hypothetical protein [Kordiimonadaceae bacterium]